MANLISNKYVIRDMTIYTEDGPISHGFLKIEGGKITELGVLEKDVEFHDFTELKLPGGCTVIPGLIDVHIHGADGADVMDGTRSALEQLSKALPREGTTSFLATTMTQSMGEIERALINVGNYIEESEFHNGAEILGVHLEGPFINKSMAGAQPVQHIMNPQIEVFKRWQELSKGNIKLVTLAPEIEGGIELIRYLKETGVIPSIGHSNATYQESVEAIEAGANHATHLFNQMRGLHHREPGVVGAVFLRNELTAELIADGVHVRPEMLNLAYKMVGSNRIVLITDSMRAKCLKNGTYDLGGQDVTVKDGRAVLSDGTLAGSILKLGQALKNMMSFTNCTLENVIQMGSSNPAKQLNVFHRKGSIAVGKDADLVVLDGNLDVYMTLCNGKIAFEEGGI